MKSIVIAVIVAATGATSAQAQVANPNNDSTMFFAQRMSSPAAPKSQQQLPKVGDVSQDGLYVFAGGERGWVHQVHRYDTAVGSTQSHSDSLPHNGPTPVKGGSVAIQSGPFAERGA